MGTCSTKTSFPTDANGDVKTQITMPRGKTTGTPRAQENTLDAMHLAFCDVSNCGMVEISVTSVKGICLCIHDMNSESTTGEKRPLSELTIQELNSLQYLQTINGLNYNQSRPVPTFIQMLDAFLRSDYHRDNHRLWVSLKDPTWVPIKTCCCYFCPEIGETKCPSVSDLLFTLMHYSLPKGINWSDFLWVGSANPWVNKVLLRDFSRVDILQKVIIADYANIKAYAPCYKCQLDHLSLIKEFPKQMPAIALETTEVNPSIVTDFRQAGVEVIMYGEDADKWKTWVEYVEI